MGSHQRPAPHGLGRGRGATLAVLSAAATAAAALGAVPAGAAPREGRAEVDRLYQEAERATEAYNEADERADTLRGEVHRARDRIARTQERVNTLRESLGSLAGAQYRSGGIDPSLALLLSSDPENYLDRAAALDRVGEGQATRLRQLRSALRELDQQRTEAGGKLAELEESRKAVARHKHAVERKLARARQVLNALPAGERAAYARASRSAGRPTATLPGTSAAPGDEAAIGARAAAAVAAARSALGRPYVWGATGPNGFDCSGLMQWAYAQAGVGLPRTSQEQRYAGRQVPLSEARPGDLVLYRSDASHVAMYVGGGQVIHAPYPGAVVRYDPVGMMPVSAVTRP
ncbi:C40 family peptidase [Streptomyces griseoaurantiacus]|uniref:Cell wall-associated hydrolase, NlpC family n=1 Tax=Streptomyces griseoaurantiacus TaxID=68213 RepID=A0A1G7PIR2_9ACTN|nr:C40 family peptidase [Streptomyces jietaisiensis]SDF86133.1 Cell wall-associated hydrolase, NlpC family [Streptomyces jietaisiensis]